MNRLDFAPGLDSLTSPDVARASRSHRLVLGSFALAFALRLVGLGGGSMWLDEVLETLMARGTLRELLSALLFDRAQPPVEPLLTWALLGLGQGELSRRLVSALLGAAAVALFSRWVARRFGNATAVLAVLLLASSPVLVRYSHELRPYSLALLFSVWALDAADRWLERGGDRFPFELAGAAALAAMTHYLAVALWVPVAAAWIEARAAGRTAALGVLAPAAAALSALPLAGWFWLLAAHGGPRQISPVAQWNWLLVETRFSDLLLRGYRGQPVAGGVALLCAILAATGLIALIRRPGGPTLVAGLAGGTALVELTLVASGRFSHLRYNQLGLLFLLTAIAAGIVALARWVGRTHRAGGSAVATLLAGLILVVALRGVVAYARIGRPDWPAVARAVVALGGPDAWVVAMHPPDRLALGYYLARIPRPSAERNGMLQDGARIGRYFDRYANWPAEPEGVSTAFNERSWLLAEISRQPAGCLLVLAGGNRATEGLFSGLGPKYPVFSLPATGAARLYRFATKGAARRDCYPPPDFAVESSPGYGALFPWLARGGAIAANPPPVAHSGRRAHPRRFVTPLSPSGAEVRFSRW